MRSIYRCNSKQSILEVELSHGEVDISCFEIMPEGEDHKRASKTISVVEARAMASQILASLKHLEDPKDE